MSAATMGSLERSWIRSVSRSLRFLEAELRYGLSRSSFMTSADLHLYRHLQIIATPSLYTKIAPSTTSSSAKRQQGGGPPGQYPGRNGGTVNLDEEMQGGSGWCSC